MVTRISKTRQLIWGEGIDWRNLPKGLDGHARLHKDIVDRVVSQSSPEFATENTILSRQLSPQGKASYHVVYSASSSPSRSA